MKLLVVTALVGLSSSIPHRLHTRQTLEDELPLRIANVRPSENEIEGNELITSASTTTTTQKTTTSSLADSTYKVELSEDSIDKSDSVDHHHSDQHKTKYKDDKPKKVHYNEHYTVVSPVKAVVGFFGGLFGAVANTVGAVVNESVDIAREVGADKQLANVSRSVGNLVIDGAGLIKTAVDYKVEAGERIFTTLGEAFDKMRENQKPSYDGKTTEATTTTTTTTTTTQAVELKPEYIRHSIE